MSDKNQVICEICQKAMGAKNQSTYCTEWCNEVQEDNDSEVKNELNK